MKTVTTFKPRTHRRTRHLASAAAIAMSIASLTLPAAAHAQTAQRSYAIEAQDLGDALRAFAVESGVDVVFDPTLVKGKRSRKLDGKYDARQGLARLIAGSGLALKATASGGYAITPGEPGVAAGGGRGDSFGEADGSTAEAQASAEGQDAEILVVGTLIRGARPAGSPIIQVTKADIQRSGAGTVGDVLKFVPQNFSGGQNSSVIGAAGTANQNNFGLSDSANLRGFGSESTLVLVNGQRLALSGAQNAVDISIIPLGAVERVDVLTDGASAIYGSDAVGGVVNFVLRKEFEGAESTVSLGKSTRGGGAELRLNQLLGAKWRSGGALINYQYLDQEVVRADQRSFAQSALDPTYLLPPVKQHSVFATAHQDVGGVLNVTAQGFYSNRQAHAYTTRATSQLGQDFDNEQYAGSVELDWSLPNGLSLRNIASLGRNAVHSDQTFISAGTPFPFEANTINDYWAVESILEGSMFALPSGVVRAALGAGLRDESYKTPESSAYNGRRRLKFAFGELQVPLLGSPGAPVLLVSTSARYEDYSDFGGHFSPKIGFSIHPVEGLRFRGTWSKAFKAPSFQSEFGQVFAQLRSIPDPQSATGQSIALIRTGPGAPIKPERATPLTVGLDYEPTWLPGARLELTYFNIRYEDRIVQPFSSIIAGLVEPGGAPFVTRNPSPSLQQAIIASADVFQNFSGQPYDPSRVAAITDFRYTNASAEKAQGIDFIGRYGWTSTYGSVDLDLNMSWLTLRRKLTPATPFAQVSGLVFNAPSFRLRTSATWTDGDISASVFFNHTSGSSDQIQSPPKRVGAWRTVDASISVTPLGANDPSLRAILSVQNLLDANPPPLSPTTTLFTGLGYDSTVASPMGRFVRLTVIKKW